MASPVDLDLFLQERSSLDEVSPLQQRIRKLGLDPASDLYQKVDMIIRGIDKLRREHRELTRGDAEIIQGWVLQKLTQDEFKEMAWRSFNDKEWNERLGQASVPHINEANDLIGATIAKIARSRCQIQVQVLDLGTGRLGTIHRVQLKLAKAGIAADFTGVDFAPRLVQGAQEIAQELRREFPSAKIAIVDADMHTYMQMVPANSFDYVTISYAIHHLHPGDQRELLKAVFACLRPDGALFVADPQEGKSDFNLRVLLREEPEGVFAAFPSPDAMLQKLTTAGFADCQVLLRDDGGCTGFLVMGIKGLRRGG